MNVFLKRKTMGQLKKISVNNIIILYGIPAHSATAVNEAADRRAKAGTKTDGIIADLLA